MSTPNIERFNEYTARIFAALYEAFPEEKAISAPAMLGIDMDEYPHPIDWPRELQIFDATLRWLEKAEYIWCKGGIQLGTIAVLSPKGLEALRATPTSLERGEPIGEALAAAIRSGSIEAAKGLVTRALTHVYGLVHQSFF